MKRDWGCVRAILLALEEKGDASTPLHPSQVEGYAVGEVVRHMDMLEAHGLITAACQRLDGAARFAVAFDLTWAGHDLLGTMKSPKVWNQLLAFARDAGVELTVQAVKEFAPRALAWVAQAAVEHGGRS